ncbi:Mediator of RNA polymerase II transcription subunit 14 [Frankliniella fusca]|uniref:Mediator of RNA polymerase II transcription subunit 14 n=1 Tax=Frankliniella fusca TaxID=407009 RepID=A0AAE1I1V0_9NEOP|nr:Mediator of RNA polymerase II transcription subunit 14 [Frankliniella fusca]
MSPVPLEGQQLLQQQPQQHQQLQQLLQQVPQQQMQSPQPQPQPPQPPQLHEEPHHQLEQEQLLLPHSMSDGQRGGTVSLATLIDYIVQRTYHELTVLAELLPKKADMERKMEIYNFAARTRQLFVRLLALVKWASSVSKVDKSAHIMAFLEKQSLLFVDTADMLARMSRETLVNACLPDFHIPAAVEILTTGTYGRLPQCIRDRIVPPEPITSTEKENTLLRLNQVIQHRLVTSNVLPQMKNVTIEGGRATFHVKHEFKVSLTVMGDGPNIPWRLLDVEILVENKEIGGGQPLVHPLQVEYVQDLIQARLADNNNSLNEVYNILHFFAQSLQLEILYSQVIRLKKERLGEYVQVHSYEPGHHLTLSYWVEQSKKEPHPELGYKFSIRVNERDSAKPLAVVHHPYLGQSETEIAEIAEKAIHSGELSLERLLVHTVHIRTRARLLDLKSEIQSLLPGVECTVSGVPTILYVPLLRPCQRAEQMLVTIDTYTGVIQCCVPQYETSLTEGIEVALNGDRSKLPTLLSELRFWVMKKRCEKSLMHLPVTVKDYLPLLSLKESPLASRLGRHHMLVQFNHHRTFILIIDLEENKGSLLDITCAFYLASVRPVSIQEEEQSAEDADNEMPKPYLKVLTLIELDTFVATHGPCTSIDESQSFGKRKKYLVSDRESHIRSKHPAYFIPELAHVVSMCEERIPFVNLCHELTKREISHQGIQVEAEGNGLVLRILTLPPPHGVSPSDPYYVALLQRLLSVSVRSSTRNQGRVWILELVFAGSPLQSTHPKEQGNRHPVFLHYDMLSEEDISKTVDLVLADWTYITQLYLLAEELSEGLKCSKYHMTELCVIKSYNYLHFIIGYGPNKEAIVTIGWDTEKNAFCLLFGISGKAIAAHALIRSQLEAFLNQNRSSILLVQVLNETYEPLASISKLSSVPQFGVISTRPAIPIQTWNMSAQTPTTLRLVYKGTFCIEVRIKGNNCVSLRDGVYSSFGSSLVPDLITAQGLTNYLSKYAMDNSPSGSQTHSSDDDNQMSPTTFDSDANTHGIGRGPNSPANPKDGLRFHAPLTPPLGSNPHTPASPHMSSIQHQQNFGSSPATSFNLASPPSISASPGVGLMSSNSPNPLSLPSPLQMPSASPQPSMIGHSPVNSFLGGHQDGSPFPSMASPVASNWPNSPATPRASPGRSGLSPGPGLSPGAGEQQQPRASTLRSWAALPTLMTYQSLDLLCTPCPLPPPAPNLPPPQVPLGTPELCPLERFLGCVYMRRQMHRFIQSEEMLIDLRTVEPGFKTECLQCRLILNPYHSQSIHLKVAPLPEYKDQMTLEEMQIIEKFFDMRVACPPYKPNSLLGLARILCTPLFVLKDFIQIMKFDLMPNLAQQANFKWSVQLCLRVPPASVAPIVPTGQPGVLLFRNKIVCFIQLSRICVGPGEGASVVLPLMYDVALRNTQVAEKREPGPALAVAAANIQLKRFAEYSASSHVGQESMLLLAVRDLLMNLNLPTDISQASSIVAGLVVGPNSCHSPLGMGGMGVHGHGMGVHAHGMGLPMGAGAHGMHMGHMAGMGPGPGPMAGMGPMMGPMSSGMGMGMGPSMGPMGMGGMGTGMPMGMMGPGHGAMGGQVGPMGPAGGMCGPFGGPMAGQMGSPMGAMGGPHVSPMGGPMGPMGPMGGNMGGPMGSHMGNMGPGAMMSQHSMMGP